MRLGWIWLLFITVACQTTPTGRRQLALIPGPQLEQMGAQAFEDLKAELKITARQEWVDYVMCVSEALLEQREDRDEWEIVVFEDDSPNAFALPGRKIGVHSGMLDVAKNQSQLATVIGHEIGHVLANHANERVSEHFVVQGSLALVGAILENKEHPNYNLLMAALGVGAQFGVLLPHSRRQETEADIIGLNLMSQAGFEPQESISLWENMSQYGGGSQPPEFLSTHPSHNTRMRTLQTHMEQAMIYFTQAPTRPQCGL